MQSNLWKRISSHLSHYFYFRKISSKILVSTIFISLTLPLAISIFLINFTENRINQYVISRNENTVTLARQLIEQFIERPLNMMNAISYNKSIIDGNTFQTRTYFIRLQRDYPIFRSISIVEAFSHRIHYSTKQSISIDSVDLFYLHEVEKNSKYLTSSVTVRNEIDPSLKTYFPVRKFGETIFIIICQIDLKYIWNLVDNITFGKYGEAILLSGGKKIIAQKDKNLKQRHEKLISSITKGDPAGTIYLTGDNGDEIIGTYARINNLDWILLIEQKADEAKDLAIEMRYNLLIYLSISFVLAILVGVLFARKLSRPIVELIDGVRRFDTKDLPQQIVIHSNDELQDLADEFNQMSKTLYYNQKKLRRIERISAMTKFIRLISHEIRNPLNSMNINMQIIKREAKKEKPSIEKLDRYLDVVSSEITRIDDLISNYTQIAKLPQLDIQKHDIHAILNTVVLTHQAEANAQNIKITTQYFTHDIWAQVDANQLKQVLINLLLNAIQAISSDGVVTIETMIKSENIFVIKIGDTGSGIESSKLLEIFEFYYTSKEAGTGIGLSLSKQIIEGHNGRIYVESEINTGSSFYVELPLKQKEA